MECKMGSGLGPWCVLLCLPCRMCLNLLKTACHLRIAIQRLSSSLFGLLEELLSHRDLTCCVAPCVHRKQAAARESYLLIALSFTRKLIQDMMTIVSFLTGSGLSAYRETASFLLQNLRMRSVVREKCVCL